MGTDLQRLQGQTLSHTLQGALTQRVKQNWRNAAILSASSLSFCFVG